MSISSPQWVWDNIQLVAFALPQCRIEFDHDEGKWLRVQGFPLPPNFVQSRTDLVLLIPGIRAPVTEAPSSYYINKSLVLRSGRSLSHVFDDNAYHGRQSLSHLGYAWFCLLLKEWHPSPDVINGDNYLTALNSAYHYLQHIEDPS